MDGKIYISKHPSQHLNQPTYIVLLTSLALRLTIKIMLATPKLSFRYMCCMCFFRFSQTLWKSELKFICKGDGDDYDGGDLDSFFICYHQFFLIITQLTGFNINVEWANHLSICSIHLLLHPPSLQIKSHIWVGKHRKLNFENYRVNVLDWMDGYRCMEFGVSCVAWYGRHGVVWCGACLLHTKLHLNAYGKYRKRWKEKCESLIKN